MCSTAANRVGKGELPRRRCFAQMAGVRQAHAPLHAKGFFSTLVWKVGLYFTELPGDPGPSHRGLRHSLHRFTEVILHQTTPVFLVWVAGEQAASGRRSVPPAVTTTLRSRSPGPQHPGKRLTGQRPPTSSLPPDKAAIGTRVS